MTNTKDIDFDYYINLFKAGKSFDAIRAELRAKGLGEEDVFSVIHLIERQLLNERRKQAENSELIYYFVGGAIIALFGLAVCLSTHSFSVGRIVSYLMMLFGVFAILIGLNKRRK